MEEVKKVIANVILQVRELEDKMRRVNQRLDTLGVSLKAARGEIDELNELFNNFQENLYRMKGDDYNE